MAKGSAKRTYKATLCLSSFRQFLYWHKRNGGGGWSVASFCLVCRVAQLFATAMEL